MKLIILITTVILAFRLSGRAEVINLKDGTKIDGEIMSEQSSVVLVKTKYGPLTINKSDIAEQQAAKSSATLKVVAPTITTVGLSTAAPAPEAPVSTAPAEDKANPTRLREYPGFTHDESDPCNNVNYIELKGKDVNTMSQREYDLFTRKDMACTQYQQNKKREDMNQNLTRAITKSVKTSSDFTTIYLILSLASLLLLLH